MSSHTKQGRVNIDTICVLIFQVQIFYTYVPFFSKFCILQLQLLYSTCTATGCESDSRTPQMKHYCGLLTSRLLTLPHFWHITLETDVPWYS